MATYGYTYYAKVQFTGNGDNFGVSTATASTGTLSDGELNTTFESGDTITGGFGGTYKGTITDQNGNVFALVKTSGSTYYMYGTTTPVGLTSGTGTNSSATYYSSGATFTVCFAAGTMIATPAGERAVETLEIGDMVLTAEGQAVPVTFLGRQTLHKVFTPADRLAPVRVAAGALGQGLPHSDLVLTAAHALIIDGLAINAGALVNGTTITRDAVETLPERVTYFHVETAGHDVILANGAPAETFVDYVSRRAFDNYADYVALYGDEQRVEDMALPRISSARLVPAAIRARLAGAKAA